MAKGTTSLIFHGGPNDGEVLTDVPGIRAYSLVSLPTGSGFTEEQDGRVGVYVKATERPSNWSMFKTAHYAKREAEQGRAGVHYDFLETVIVCRCRAFTIKNEWCKNEAVADQKVCQTHARSAAVALKPEL